MLDLWRQGGEALQEAAANSIALVQGQPEPIRVRVRVRVDMPTRAPSGGTIFGRPVGKVDKVAFLIANLVDWKKKQSFLGAIEF